MHCPQADTSRVLIKKVEDEMESFAKLNRVFIKERGKNTD